jgi:hypothetical protein
LIKIYLFLISSIIQTRSKHIKTQKDAKTFQLLPGQDAGLLLPDCLHRDWTTLKEPVWESEEPKEYNAKCISISS